jgi:hypothetical protein
MLRRSREFFDETTTPKLGRRHAVQRSGSTTGTAGCWPIGSRQPTDRCGLSREENSKDCASVAAASRPLRRGRGLHAASSLTVWAPRTDRMSDCAPFDGAQLLGVTNRRVPRETIRKLAVQPLCWTPPRGDCCVNSYRLATRRVNTQLLSLFVAQRPPSSKRLVVSERASRIRPPGRAATVPTPDRAGEGAACPRPDGSDGSGRSVAGDSSAD